MDTTGTVRRAREPADACAFFGRARELAELRAGLDDTLAGRGRLFLVTGEPGIGKTRLAEELTVEARARGFSAVWGRCWEGGGAPANWPWIQVIRALAASRGWNAMASNLGPDAAYVAQLVPELRERVPAIPDLAPPASPLDAERARFRVFDACSALLKREASTRPVLLILDDLHAADVDSLLLLQFLARELVDSPMSIVGTYRDAEARSTPAVLAALTNVAREGRILHLIGLGEAEVSRLIASVGGQVPAAELVAAVHRKTDGNPFFVHAVARMLRVEGANEIRIPDEVRESIRRRLRPLAADARRLLTIAAVIGREFDLALLAAASELPRARALALLEEGAAAVILEETPGRSRLFRFAHTLIRDTLYEDTPADARVDLHRRVGDALASLCAGEPDARLSELAHHFSEAIPTGTLDLAIDYSIRAGRQATAMFAIEQAIEHYQHAREALATSAPDDPRRLDVLLELGDALIRRVDYAPAREIFEEAFALARAASRAGELARAASRMVTDTTGEYDETAIAAVEHALQAVGDGDSVLRAQLLTTLGMQLLFSPEEERRRNVLTEAVAIARRIGDAGTLAHGLARLHMVWTGDARLRERFEITEELRRVARASGERDLVLVAHMASVVDALELGDMARFDAEVAEYDRLAREIRHQWHVSNAAAFRTGSAIMRGALAEAERLTRELCEVRRDDIEARIISAAQMAEIRRMQGHAEELEAQVRRAMTDFPRVPAWRSYLALACAEDGNPGEARAELERFAARDFADVAHDYVWPAVIRNLSLACAALRDARNAARLYELLRPYAGRNLLIGYAIGVAGPADHLLGLLAATMSRWADAERHFELAIGRNLAMGASAFVAQASFDYARMLLDRGRVADRSKAVDLLDRALEIARHLGMNGLMARITSATEGAVETVSKSRAEPELFRREGDFWTIGYQGTVFRLKTSRGLEQLSRLLREPGREFHCGELADSGAGPGLGLSSDVKARYERTLEDLREALHEAERFHDFGRAARAREAIDAIGRDLAVQFGLGGRFPTTAAERARLNVTRTLRMAIDRIAGHSASLGHHLSTFVRTGIFCSYAPDPETRPSWTF